MNKQEAIKRVEQMGEYERFIDEPVSKKSVLNIISQIQEPRSKSTNIAFDLIVLSGIVVFLIIIWAIIIGMICLITLKTTKGKSSAIYTKIQNWWRGRL